MMPSLGQTPRAVFVQRLFGGVRISAMLSALYYPQPPSQGWHKAYSGSVLLSPTHPKTLCETLLGVPGSLISIQLLGASKPEIST